MNKKIILAVALLALVGAACVKKNDQSNAEQQSTQNEQATSADTTAGASADVSLGVNQPAGGQFSDENDIQPTAQPEVIEVQMTASGFVPATVTIKKGDYVQFTNKDSVLHQPASGPHPQNNGLPGFDALKGLATGENYRFQFNQTGSFGYHDHLNASGYGFGKVIVE